MIVEIADIEIRGGQEADFESAVAKAVPLFLAAKGCRGLQLHRAIERTSRYHLVVRWETLEDHTVTFRGSAVFTRWRELVGSHFTSAPQVQHVQVVIATD
jgi:heme-degrading monooxygenase HmoA